jgi:hypothetical protein
MKNIHLIPTDKPSRLYYYYSHLGLARNLVKQNDGVKPQHIYITSDEEIEEGNWRFDLKDNDFYKTTISELGEIHNCKKIILTTDQELIVDGVQAMDDEFLQWFVKNPSCEEVEITRPNKCKIVGCNLECILFKTCKNIYIGYQIIIPQEEPKPHSFCETPEEKCTMNYCDENGCQNRKRNLVEPKQETERGLIIKKSDGSIIKQETLEEAAKNYVRNEFDATLKLISKYSFTDGAKWQAKRMYSEEDFKLFARKFYREIKMDKSNMMWEYLADLCFEQFKKK